MGANAQTLKANLENPARVYLWELALPEVTATPSAAGVSTPLSVRCQTTSIPGRSNGDIHTNYQGSEGFHVPGRLRFPGTLDVTILEGEDGIVLDYLQRWQEQIASQSTGSASPDADLKKTLILSLLKKVSGRFFRIDLIGAWILNRPDVPVTYEQDQILTYSVTFQYDFWQSKLGG